jgi:hypothetical protein
MYIDNIAYFKIYTIILHALEKTGREIKSGQSRDNDNIGHRTKTNN